MLLLLDQVIDNSLSGHRIFRLTTQLNYIEDGVTSLPEGEADSNTRNENFILKAY